jgi:anaerobic magnesium-protoporphyrin IX monomethyl ester cyclase
MLDFLIVKPGNQKLLYGQASEFQLTAIEPPYWPLLLASYIQNEGRSVKIIDLEVSSLGELGVELVYSKPINVIICISGHNPSASLMNMVGLDILCEVIKSVGKPKIFLHGLYPSVRSLDILSKHILIDEVILGEGFTYLNFLNGYVRSDKVTINDIPPIDWNLINLNDYRAHNWHCFGNINNRSSYGIMYSSWGCPFACEFCCIHSMHKYPQLKNIDLVFNDLKNLYDKGVRNIKFMDELFTMSKKRVVQLCNLINENNMSDMNIWVYARAEDLTKDFVLLMKSAGIQWLALGFESGSQTILDSSNKKQKVEYIHEAVDICKEAKINIGANFMFGLLEDNFETMQQTLDLAQEINAEWVNFNVVHAFPGTKLFEKVKKELWFKEPENYEQYSQHGYYTTPMGTKYLTPAKVLEFRDHAFNTYFTSKKYLDMIENKFGIETRYYIEEMTKIKVRRKLLGD